MTRLEYVRQFPGLEDMTNNTLDCPREYGLDEDKCGGGCYGCFDKEATIDGKPVPYAFFCPIHLGQKIYRVGRFNVYEETVDAITFGSNGKWYALKEDLWEWITNSDDWMIHAFPTHEEALKKFLEMNGRGAEFKEDEE